MRKASALVLGFTILMAFFFSCQSAQLPPEATEIEVDPLSLLEDDLGVYLCLPPRGNKSLCVKVIRACIDGLSETDAESIAERIETLYAGCGRIDDRSAMEAAFKISIPEVFLKSALSEEKGWASSYYEDDTVRLERLGNDAAGFEVSLLPGNTMCIAQNVSPLLENYSQLVSRVASNDAAALEPTREEKAWTPWLKQADTDDIYFYITRPGQYLRALIGQSINLGAEAVYGQFTPRTVSNGDTLYDLSFNVRLTQKRSVTALRSLLSLSFAISGGSVTQIDDLTLNLSGVEISENQIISMFFLEQIRSHHYKVVDDKIVEDSI